jgi:hypothetical protein
MEDLSPAARALGAILGGRHAVGSLDASLAAAALRHGVGPLVYRTLVDRGNVSASPPAIADMLARSAREAVVTEPLRRAHLQKVGDALAEQGIRPLVFKGAALAYSHYAEPWLRSRGDTDLLVRGDEVPGVDAVLTKLGLERFPRPDGPRVTQQACYTATTQSIEIAYDVHWRIADPHVFASTFSYDHLLAESVEGPVPGLRRLGDVHALLVACVHRAAHHADSDHVRFLFDISLIAGRLTDSDWRRFVELAETAQVRTVCSRGLTLASELFGRCAPEDVGRRLSAAQAEPSAVFVSRRMSRLDVLRSDLRALPTWRDRMGLLYEHVLPSGDYMRTAGDRPDRALPLLYLERVVRGLQAWRLPL